MANNLSDGKILRLEIDGIEVEYEVSPPCNYYTETDPRRETINNELRNIEDEIQTKYQQIDELNIEIDRLTSHADNIDYLVAVSSGIIAGLIDSFWVGEFSLERGTSWGKEKVNNFVIKIAQSQGYKGNDLEGAIKFLEERYGAPSDSNTSDYGGGLQHHLRDFAHHPTLIGLIFSLLTQFTGKAYGTDTKGSWLVVDVRNKALIGKDLPQKILFGVVYWFFHMVSDMAGSSSYPGAGTGLPGPLVALIKELSVLPFFKNIKITGTELSVWISKLFNGTLLAERDSNGKITKAVRFDLRAELGVAYELGRQAVPVIVNECIVRGFYFARRLTEEIRERNISSLSELSNVEWKKTLPIKNRTVIRMLTISTGTFLALDLADAAIRGAVKSKGTPVMFAKEFVLRINFINVGRFAIAIGTDIVMGIQRSKRRNERIALYNQQLHLLNARVFYKQADMWIAVEAGAIATSEAYDMMVQSVICHYEAMLYMNNSLNSISDSLLQKIDSINPGFRDELLDEFKF